MSFKRKSRNSIGFGLTEMKRANAALGRQISGGSYNLYQQDQMKE